MPTVTLNRGDITKEAVVAAVQDQLGSRYTATPRDDRDVVHVNQSVLSFANVRILHEGGTTKLHVHGGGLLIGRLVNELTIARRVAAALRDAPGLAAHS